MKVTIAMDSLKGSLTSIEAGEAVKTGIRRVYPDAEIAVRPLADGGEGTAYALTAGMGGEWVTMDVTGPLGKPVKCKYGIVVSECPAFQAETERDADRKTVNRAAGEKTAIIEMASAAGIMLLQDSEKDPMHTTTYGVGEMIADAIGRGCRRFIVGIGGSATNDGGVGMLQALGYGFLNKEGKQVAFGAEGLSELAEITDDHVIPELSECTFQVACDVTNPLCGERGCSAVFGPQKGASPDMIRKMDQWLADFAALSEEKYPKADRNKPGTGAAGGLGFAFLAYTNAVLKSGIRIVLEETNLRKYIVESDFVITGEGCLDRQTVMGKAPAGVAEIAKEYGKPVIAFAGGVTKEAGACNEAGIDAFFPIIRNAVPLEEAMKPENASANMSDTAEQVFRLIKLISG